MRTLQRAFQQVLRTPNRQNDIVQQGNNCSHSKCKFKPRGDINKNTNDSNGPGYQRLRANSSRTTLPTLSLCSMRNFASGNFSSRSVNSVAGSWRAALANTDFRGSLARTHRLTFSFLVMALSACRRPVEGLQTGQTERSQSDKHKSAHRSFGVPLQVDAAHSDPIRFNLSRRKQLYLVHPRIA